MRNAEEIREEIEDIYNMLRRSEDASDMFKLDKKYKRELENKQQQLQKEINEINRINGTEY